MTFAAVRLLILGIVLIGSTGAFAQPAKPDTSPHKSEFLNANGIRIHYLDWGGTGDALILLTGTGDTAHAFDGFAPEFTDRFRVIALTRRGYGESDKPETGYDAKTLAKDVVEVLKKLKIDKANFAGHSAAGDELTTLAIEYPKRVLKLVYLDAAYDRREVAAMEDKDPMGRDEPYDMYQDMHFRAMDKFVPNYKKIKAPALAFYAIFEQHWAIKRDTPEPLRSKAQEFFDSLVKPYQRRNIDLFRSTVKKGKVIEMTGTHHYFFRDPAKKKEVIDAIRLFLKG